jgi:hypothetical protein
MKNLITKRRPDIENDPTVDRAVYPDNIFSAPSAETCPDKAESLPADYVLKEGKSKFYRKSIDDLDKITDDELDYDDPQTMNTDAISQTSVQTADTLPVKDILN